MNETDVFAEDLDELKLAQLLTEIFCPREMQVFKLMSRAIPVKQIADTLHIADKTVMTYRRQISRKLGVYNATAVCILSWRLRHHLPKI